MSENLEIWRKRLRYRSRHRGTRELDLLLGSFAERELDSLSAEQLGRYEALLELPEPVLYAWLSGQGAPPSEFDHEVTRRLLGFRFSANGS